MMYTRKQYRLGSTAIAAVIALSSTPLAAQEVPSTTDTTPVEATTTAPEPAAPAADPLAPAAAPEVTSTPVETTSTTTEAEAAPAAKPVAKKLATKTVRTVQRTAAKAAPASVAPPAAPPVAEAAPATAAPAPAPVAAIEPAPEVAPVAEAQPGKDAQIKEALPIAGGAGAVILALAGAGMAVRRKRRKEDEEFEHHWLDDDELVLADEIDSEPTPQVQQASWDPPIHAPAVPMPAAMEPTAVPDSFDTSDFGRHVKAAYEGPTPDNPSLSLRKRLKIAGELDRRERLGLAEKPIQATKPVTAKPEKMAMSFGGTATQVKVPEYQF